MESPTTSGRSTPNSSRPASSSIMGGTNRSQGRPMGAEKLMTVVEEIYKSYNSAQTTLDTHVDNSVTSRQIYNSFDDIFVRQVIYGSYRYKRFLDSFMDSFYHYNSGTVLRDDIDMYKIYAYLTIFRLEELTMPQYRRLVDAKDPQKMLAILQYLYNEKYLKEVVRDDWLKIYDKEFVEGIVASILKFKTEMSALISNLEDRVFLTRKKTIDEKDGQSTSTKRNTLQQPFNLTQPKPKLVPVEEASPPPIRARPAPKFGQGPTKDELALAEARKKNKEVIEAKYKDPKHGPFKLRILERPSNLDQLKKELEEEEARTINFSGPKANPLPPAPHAQVKLNAAAILREDALYRKKQVEEAEALKRYETDLRDAAAFKQWQAETRASDEETRKAEVEARRKEMAAAAEGAIRARQQTIDENLELGRALKEEKEERLEQLKKEREEDLALNQQRRDAVQAEKEKVSQALERVVIDRKATAEEIRRQAAEEARQRAEEEVKEMAERRDIILQLRALEKVPKPRVKEFDPSKVPDHGLLNALSMVELRERLEMLKKKKQDEEERMRSDVLAKKQERESAILKKAANVHRIRNIAAAQAEARRIQAKVEAGENSERTAVKHESDVLKLHDKLEAKRAALAAERGRVAAEEKRIKFEMMQQAAGASAVEEEKFRELREGARRELVARQVHRVETAAEAERKRNLEAAARLKTAKQQLKAKGDFLQAYDEKVRQLALEGGQAAAADFTYRANLVASQRATETNAHQTRSTTGYVPFSGSRTSMQAKLQALAQGVEL